VCRTKSKDTRWPGPLTCSSLKPLRAPGRGRGRGLSWGVYPITYYGNRPALVAPVAFVCRTRSRGSHPHLQLAEALARAGEGEGLELGLGGSGVGPRVVVIGHLQLDLRAGTMVLPNVLWFDNGQRVALISLPCSSLDGSIPPAPLEG
jgi:hypothetical protein